MKHKFMLVLILLFSSISLFSQVRLGVDTGEEEAPEKDRMCLTYGLLQGGGALFGADLELLVTDYVGLQVGGGFVGFGGGINFHFDPHIKSSFISVQYWNQGIGDTFSQNVLSANYVFRAKKWFTFQIGSGYIIERSTEMVEKAGNIPFMLTYSIGFYTTF